LATGQSLPQYPLRIEEGMLFIKAPVRLVGSSGGRRQGEA
jgi:hypothetical protein